VDKGIAKKSILFFSTGSGPGGAERLVDQLAVSMNGGMFSSHVCLFRPGWLLDQCRTHGIPTDVIPNNGLFDIMWLFRFLRLLREQHIQIIHAHEFDAIVHGAMAAAIAGVPMIGTIHGKHYYWEKWSRRLAYRLVSRYAGLVAVSEDLRQFVIQRVGIRPGRISLIYNGVNPTPHIAVAEQRQCRSDIGINVEDQVVGVVGSLYPVKGHKYLIQAAVEVTKACPSVKFLLIGRGELETVLKDQVKQLDMEHYFRFLGLRNDVPRLLSIMDVFVLPSLSEGLSVALLEAMAAAKPVVATRVGGNPEIVQDGQTGVLVPSEDSKSLAKALISILSDGLKSRTMGLNGLRRVQECFTTNVMVENYRRLYEHCLNN
jgi:glycosyltransferase involved in cell wall biosynthesis